MCIIYAYLSQYLKRYKHFVYLNSIPSICIFNAIFSNKKIVIVNFFEKKAVFNIITRNNIGKFFTDLKFEIRTIDCNSEYVLIDMFAIFYTLSM